MSSLHYQSIFLSVQRRTSWISFILILLILFFVYTRTTLHYINDYWAPSNAVVFQWLTVAYCETRLLFNWDTITLNYNASQPFVFLSKTSAFYSWIFHLTLWELHLGFPTNKLLEIPHRLSFVDNIIVAGRSKRREETDDRYWIHRL